MTDHYNVSRLMPLYLPFGWEVVINDFFDYDLEALGEEIINDRYFGESLLALSYRRSVVNTEDSGRLSLNYYIWLGWYPEYSVEGRYVLTAACEDENIGRFESKNRQEISRALQHCVSLMLHSDLPVSQISYTHLLFQKEGRAGQEETGPETSDASL